MKNLTFVFFAMVLTVNVFGQTETTSFFSPFIQKSDTITLVGLSPEQVTLELADYLSDISVESRISINEKFSDDFVTEIYKASVTEAIEEQSKIISRFEKFRTKVLNAGGKNPSVDYKVVIHAKKGTILKFIN